AKATEQAERQKSVDVTRAEKEMAEAKLAAEAAQVRAAVEAEAQKLVNEAENILTEPARASLFKRNLLTRLEGIIAAQVKPLEKINEIKIMELGGAGAGAFGNGTSRGSPTDEVINSALRYRVQAPMIDELMHDIGIDGANLAKQSGLIREAADMQRVANEASKAPKDDSPGGSGDPDGSKGSS
ncbi:MAG: flotillin domain-containing protein, partial [Pseudomonadota bacterium]